MFSINLRDSRPIYKQVKDGLRRAVISGILLPDDRVPSVRELASQLAINPNTIQKVYRELETEGYLYSVPGKGSFVSESSLARESRKKELLKKLDETVSELSHLDVTIMEICEHIKKRAGEEKQV